MLEQAHSVGNSKVHHFLDLSSPLTFELMGHVNSYIYTHPTKAKVFYNSTQGLVIETSYLILGKKMLAIIVIHPKLS